MLGLAYAHALALCPASARLGGRSLASLVPESSKSHAKTEPSRALATLSFCEYGDLSRFTSRPDDIEKRPRCFLRDVNFYMSDVPV